MFGLEVLTWIVLIVMVMMMVLFAGKLAHSDLDERALDALKEFPVDGALTVLKQFLDSNLEHVSNKSAYLCGVMKTYRQKSRSGQNNAPPVQRYE